MIAVRRMSALPRHFPAVFGLVAGQHTNKNGPKCAVQFSPKAKVGRSNRLGRAIFCWRLFSIRSADNFSRTKATGKLWASTS
jgi:hypothetical protein